MEVPAQHQGQAELLCRDVRSQRWGDGTSRSGSGSNLENTGVLRAELPALLARLDIRALLDLPCGDWAWMQHVDLSGLDRYIGGDVVPAIVEHVRREHSAPGREFVQLDALSTDLPKVDAVMIRDLFGHLDHAQVRRLVRNVKSSGAKWLLATHYPDLAANTNIAMGCWRPQNFTLPPYSWPEPMDLLWERPPDTLAREDKTLAAWSLADVQVH